MSPGHKIFAERNRDVGTDGRDRTGTPIKEQDFKSCVSTSSTTPAQLDSPLVVARNMAGRRQIESAFLNKFTSILCATA